MEVGAEVEYWMRRFLTNAELRGKDLPPHVPTLAETFDLDRVWGPRNVHLLPEGFAERVEREGLPDSLTLLRTWLHQQSRRLRVLTQDWAEPEEEALLHQLANAVPERGLAADSEDETHYVAGQLCAPAAPIVWAVYEDPQTRGRSSLLGGLMSQPTTQAQHPIENQFSEVLAFLVDRSQPFGAAVARLCGDERDDQLADAITMAESIGARTQLSLPVAKPANDSRRGFLFPDVSIEGSGRCFQILLEVKVDAELHRAEVGGVSLPQPDAYAAAWRRVKDPAPARVRRVCTLTRDKLDLAESDPMRSSSVTWAQVAQLIADQEAASMIPADIRLVADEFRAAIGDWILPPAVSAEELVYLSAVAAPLLDAFANAVSAGYGGLVRADPIRTEEDFIHRFVHLQVEGNPLRLLIRVTPEGAQYNLPGRPASVALQFMIDTNERLPSELESVALSCGMYHTRNRAGYVALRRFINVPPRLDDEAAALLGVELADQVVGALKLS